MFPIMIKQPQRAMVILLTFDQKPVSFAQTSPWNMADHQRFVRPNMGKKQNIIEWRIRVSTSAYKAGAPPFDIQLQKLHCVMVLSCKVEFEIQRGRRKEKKSSSHDLNLPHFKSVAFLRISNPDFTQSPWRNRSARSAVNRKVGGSIPPGDDSFCFQMLWLPGNAIDR